MSIKPPYKMESYGGGFASSMCGSCQESIGAGTRYKELRCSRCGAASYCSPECQRKVWPTHKIECKASVKRQQRLDELTLRDPHKAALEVALNLYGYDILGEIIQIPMRTLLRLGHPDQCCHSHLLRLHFDYNSSGETERLSFIFTEAEVVSFEEEEKRLEGVEDPTVYIPTLEEREERKPSATATSVRASVDLVARDVKLGFETNRYEPSTSSSRPSLSSPSPNGSSIPAGRNASGSLSVSQTGRTP
ncbi:hypothetical protein BCR35DRAFT_38416 [Leucosporidium creatinivorum]|uniref:MYND-type domain-containing protein n=1 Tax=Leucosporidium creatinivorum TaxID=106004 RepID=A0A1Y2FTT5_9BASI|nr:hypothetical protein BCR35DRAFT_38416 [Leucosporidium creatinivorum]